MYQYPSSVEYGQNVQSVQNGQNVQNVQSNVQQPNPYEQASQQLMFSSSPDMTGTTGVGGMACQQMMYSPTPVGFHPAMMQYMPMPLPGMMQPMSPIYRSYPVVQSQHAFLPPPYDPMFAGARGPSHHRRSSKSRYSNFKNANPFAHSGGQADWSEENDNGDYDNVGFGPGPPIITSDQLKGPRGSNVFVFHLPNEFSNWDLYVLFRSYGTILSVSVMVNRDTGLSRGFGFVSFSSPEEAKAAITGVDGRKMGVKILKVQLKRSRDDQPEDSSDSRDEGLNSCASENQTTCSDSLTTNGDSLPRSAADDVTAMTTAVKALCVSETAPSANEKTGGGVKSNGDGSSDGGCVGKTSVSVSVNAIVKSVVQAGGGGGSNQKSENASVQKGAWNRGGGGQRGGGRGQQQQSKPAVGKKVSPERPAGFDVNAHDTLVPTSV